MIFTLDYSNLKREMNIRGPLALPKFKFIISTETQVNFIVFLFSKFYTSTLL